MDDIQGDEIWCTEDKFVRLIHSAESKKYVLIVGSDAVVMPEDDATLIAAAIISKGKLA